MSFQESEQEDALIGDWRGEHVNLILEKVISFSEKGAHKFEIGFQI